MASIRICFAKSEWKLHSDGNQESGERIYRNLTRDGTRKQFKVARRRHSNGLELCFRASIKASHGSIKNLSHALFNHVKVPASEKFGILHKQLSMLVVDKFARLLEMLESLKPISADRSSLVALASYGDKKTALEIEEEVGEEGQEELPLKYNPVAIASYFKGRHGIVIMRCLEIALACSVFAIHILIDKTLKKEKEKENLRAAEFLKLITGLGPTAVKIGQALSIRPDILPSAYLEQLRKLQDKVAPFSNQLAMELIAKQIGKEVYSDISPQPVAAGSLGQVYKACLYKTGDVVAVKVQRPGVLKSISCDLFILRSTAFMLHSLFNIDTDFVDILDTWAVRFFDELDYRKEASNAQRFSKNMASVPMIVVPEVYMQYTSCKVLTTKWVDGEKLSETKALDVVSLVRTALNCYLIQLLENGFLHADPHPGNLLRTPDGRLCILDYGLMTEVTEDQQLALFEYIAHLVNSDYEELAQDLVRLGFLPTQLVDPAMAAAILPEITQIFTELVRGGGARKVNVQEIADGLTKISQDYTVVIPSYFSLILRAFSLLEGIGLELNPDYAIVQDCYPYIAKRLLTDDSPRMRKVVKYILSSGKNQLDVKRLEYIVSSLQDFQQLISVDRGAPANSNNPATKQALLLLVAPEGSLLQELVLAEIVRLVDALSRRARLQMFEFFASVLNLPVPIPKFLVGVSQLSAEDLKSLENIERLWVLLQPHILHRSFATGISAQLVPLLSDLFPGAAVIAQKFVLMLVQRQALRFADELNGGSAVVEWDRDPAALARQIEPFVVPKTPGFL